MDRFLATFALTYRNKVKAKSFLIFTGIVVILILAPLSNKSMILLMLPAAKIKITTMPVKIRNDFAFTLLR